MALAPKPGYDDAAWAALTADPAIARTADGGRDRRRRGMVGPAARGCASAGACR